MRWPIIRHVRALYWAWHLDRWTNECRQIGLGGAGPNEADVEHLNNIWDGKA